MTAHGLLAWVITLRVGACFGTFAKTHKMPFTFSCQVVCTRDSCTSHIGLRAKKGSLEQSVTEDDVRLRTVPQRSTRFTNRICLRPPHQTATMIYGHQMVGLTLS